MKNKVGVCPKCTQNSLLTRHHIKPKRFFGNNNQEILMICRNCHNDLEKLIPQKEKMQDSFYITIVDLFLGAKTGYRNVL